MTTSRRDLLKTLTTAGLAAGLPWSALAAQPTSPAGSTLLRRPIPSTSELLPVVGFGSTAAVRQVLTDGPATLTSLLDAMLALGARVVDTAPREPEVDEAFGQVLQLPRFHDGLFVTTKVGLNRFLPERRVDTQGGIRQYEQTRKFFGRRPADLIQVESMTDMDQHWPTLMEWKRTGEARYIGVTTSDTADHGRLETFMRTDRPDFIQVNFSLLEPDAEARVLPLARDRGMAVLVNSPFNGGEYFKAVAGAALPDWAREFDCTSWAQFNLKFILGHPVITSVLTETTKVANLRENLGTGMGRLPDQAMRERMLAHFRSMRKA